MYENYLCYFCDETFPYPSCFIENYNNYWVCDTCTNTIPVNIIQEKEDCCVCFEVKDLIKLPTCNHTVCFECCKTIYFGSTKNERPKHWRDIMDECPDFPNLNDDDENDPNRIKMEEYFDYNDKHFDIETNTYDELIEIRNSLISERPEWMNTPEIINYENKTFRYHTEFVKLDREWEKYNETKTKGNSTCPLCRAKTL